MKIYVNARFLTQPVSGVQRYAIECSRKIKKLHSDCVFLAPGNILNTAVATELQAKVIGTKTSHLWEQADLPRYLRKQNSPPLFNPCNTAPYLYANNYITLHDLAFHHHPEWNSRLFSLWYNTLIPRIVKRSSHLFTVSNTMRDEIMKYYKVPANDISVTYNGISQEMMAMGKTTIMQKEKIILAVGSFNARKNHHSLINAFLQSSIKDTYRLVIIGDKSKVFSETGIDEAELQRNNIEVLRQLAEDELIRMYQRAEIVASLSAYEGFGIPILEGLYNGCKAVCSDIPVYRELYSGVARFCHSGSATSIIEAIIRASHAPQPTAAQIAQLTNKYNFDSSAKVIIEKMLNG